MTISPPPSLPDFIFLLSDHQTRALACDVAKKLAENNDSVRVDDFLYPIHEAIQSWSVGDDNWTTDYGDPRIITPACQDQINSLEAWFNSCHGEDKLGQIAFDEDSQGLVDFTHIYRDATWTHIKLFLAALKLHQFIIVDLLPPYQSRQELSIRGMTRLIFIDPTVDKIVTAILEASK